MAGLLYILIALFAGSIITRAVFPRLAALTQKDYYGRELKINSMFVLLPAWLYVGLIPMTWCVYLVSYLFRAQEHPMTIANAFTMLVFLTGAVIGVVLLRKKKVSLLGEGAVRKPLLKSELVFLALVLILAVTLFWQTFCVKDGVLYVGLSVFSDFSPHLGMIRSFSTGDNFPTVYSHYAGEDIKYHFMFQFLVGNLEYLGIRLDYAFNLPSALGFVSTFSLLYVFAAKLLGKRAGGYLTTLLFAFRSSFSVFSYLAELPKEEDKLKAFLNNSTFIGYSANEDWGLWNLNVYCNQRHLAFTLGVMLLVLLLFVPYLFEAFERFKRFKKKTVAGFVKESLFSAEGWRLGDWKLAVFGGLLLGMLAFWNGAVTIAALLVLFVLAVISDHRLDFLILAIITVLLSFLQSNAFIDGSAVATTLQYGFIAENKTFFGVLDYIYRLTGALFAVVFAAFLISDKEKRYITVAFLAPFVFSFHVSLTTDVTVNHKYIMISLMLLGILEAYALTRLWELKKLGMRFAAVLLTVLLTITGMFDYLTVMNRNKQANNLAFDMEDPLMLWIQENSDAEDIFLTSNYALNSVVLGGAMLYNGWQYFAWSAGYDTAYRDMQVREMYEADSVELLMELTEEHNIRFIIVDHDCRMNAEYDVREDVISSAFARVYTEDEGDWQVNIYDVQQPLY
ncbi:MAG: hypothetical protein IJY09_04970 [Lachnospiraceae bacterium]|nr:hypothetical protein [Lachnospiraceae bacterium]